MAESELNQTFYVEDPLYDDELITQVSLPLHNCTPLTIFEFPQDIFTQEQRRKGFVLFHFFVSLYVFYAFAIVCRDYFVPSVERLSEELQMESDIAGATLMGIATSSPELFTNIVGVFITKGDMGVGTVVGSAVFNLLAVGACIGFAIRGPSNLDWWPVTRDMFFYGLSVIALFLILLDLKIYWYESVLLLAIYVLYIYALYFDITVHAFVCYLLCMSDSVISNALRMRRRRRKCKWTVGESHPPNFDLNCNSNCNGNGASFSSQATVFTIGSETTNNNSQAQLNKEQNDSCIDLMKPYRLPKGQSNISWIQWVIGWPARVVFSITIPDCRPGHFQRMYPLTFLMSTLWIAALSYLTSWMMTVVGHTFGVPDTVFGVSLIAAGTSVPEAVSSVIVARKGLGTMAVSNSIGSNTFDILVCLGIPWLIRALVNHNLPNNYAEINSLALDYSTAVLMVSLICMYILMACNRFCMDKKIATCALLLYLAFLAFDSLMELNVFLPVNLPLCDIQ